MYLGIDIGTTSVCASLLDAQGNTLLTVNRPNDFGKISGHARTQDVDKIYALCESIYHEIAEKYSVLSIGVSGQMHGVLYADGEGNAVSPLYSWQDERGNLPYGTSSYAAALSEKTGYAVASGFGSVSLFYDHENGLIPQSAACILTVGDYVAMRLCGRKTPLLHTTMAASLGLFDIENGVWDEEAIEKAALPRALFPAVTGEIALLGKTDFGACVYTALGDNQASVYGATEDDGAFLLNVGTGSQISVITDAFVRPSVGEVRPFLNGKFLLAGCPLCGGHSYRLLKDFFESVAGAPVDYAKMNAWAKEAFSSDVAAPEVSPRFRGTRRDPSCRASVTGLSEANFNAAALTLGVLKGISGELKEFYDAFKPYAGRDPHPVGAGNAVRMNEVLRFVMEQDYGMPLSVPAHTEEAAFGAALAAAEVYEGRSLKHFIRYN